MGNVQVSMRLFLICLISLNVVSNTFAQEVPSSLPDFETSGDYLVEGLAYYTNEQSDLALESFEKIHESDTNYAVSISVRASILNEKEEYEKAEVLSKEALTGNYPKRNLHYSNLVTSLSSQEKYEEALGVVEKGLTEFPYNNTLLYHKVLLYDKSGEQSKCAEFLMSSLRKRYFFPKLHLKAGYLARDENEVSKSMMAVGFYLILNPKTNASANVLGLLNEDMQSKHKGEPKQFQFTSSGDDFSEIDLLINNYVALNKKYKTPAKLELPFIKQYHLLLTKLEYDASDDGFFMDYYVPIYKKIIDQNRFKSFAYTLLYSSQNQKHEALVAKHISEVRTFRRWFYDELAKLYQEQEVEIKGQKEKAKVWFDANDRVNMIGDYDVVAKTPKGHFVFYQENGALSTEGSYDASGKKTGEWRRYHENSKLSEINRYKNDLLDGLSSVYHENGNLEIEVNFVKGKRTGVTKYYNKQGVLLRSVTYKENILEGPASYYHTIGKKKYTIQYQEGKVEGDYTFINANGKTKETGQFSEDRRKGLFVTYFDNGKISSKYNYDGESRYSGEAEEYFMNGQLERKGVYEKGKELGEWNIYYYDGAQKRKYVFDESGKVNGASIEYDVDGIKHAKTEYKKGDIFATTFYNKKGGIIQENKAKGKNLLHIGYTPMGHKEVEGMYRNHLKDGVWNYYFNNGELYYKQRMKEGELDGIQTYYYSNGQLHQIYKEVKGSTEGLYTSYYENGDKEEEGYYYKNERAGEWIEYYHNGNVESKTFYVNGQRVGKSYDYAVNGKLDDVDEHINGVLVKITQYDSLGNVFNVQSIPNGTGDVLNKLPDGRKYSKLHYLNGVAHGEFTWYFPNGKLRLKGTYFNGERHGEWKWYRAQGTPEMLGEYEYGDRVGKWTEYNHQGALEEEYSYENGKMEGQNVQYYEDGKVSYTQMYRQGNRHGVAKFYTENGEIEHIRYYHDGEVVSYSYIGKDGKEVEPIKIEGQTAKVISYYPSGEVSREYSLNKGRFDGEYKKYHKSGKIKAISKYDKGIQDGEDVDYYENGKLKNKLIYKNNQLEGQQRYYYDNGQLKRIQTYMSGTKHGWTTYYDRNGVTILRLKYYDGEVIEMLN